MLRGAAGACVGLPLLEAMLPSGKTCAATLLKNRFILGFGGISMGISEGAADLMTPNQTGRDFAFRPASASLQSVRPDVSLITGLEIPVSKTAADPGGRNPRFHSAPVGPLLCGIRTDSSTTSHVPQGITADVVANNALARGKATHARPLVVGVQAFGYRARDEKGQISYFRNQRNELQVNNPFKSPRDLWSLLFTDLVPGDSVNLSAWRNIQAKKKSMLDLVLENSKSLEAKLGMSDRRRLDQHMTELRLLEQQLENAAPPNPDSACRPPLDPGPDPRKETISWKANSGKERVTGWADETSRGELINDFIRMAFVCDSHVSASICYTYVQSFLTTAYVSQASPSEFHQSSHTPDGNGNESSARMSKCIDWHCELFADLIQKLKATEEGEGNLLDSTAAVLVFEGGHGYDPNQKKQRSPHSTENMSVVIGGRAGVLNHGRHLRKPGVHPSQVIITALSAVGAGNELGELRGGIEELL